MWTKDRSVTLSVWCTVAMIVLLGLTALTLPFGLHSGLTIAGVAIYEDHGPTLLLLYYCFCVPALVALVGTYMIVTNIRRDIVFDVRNVKLLRVVSWAALAGGVVCLAGTPISLAFLAVGMVCAFAGVIVRVVKNLITAAVDLKTENDLTI